MSADSWYLSLALSFEIRTEALTVKEIWQFKDFPKKHCPEIWVQEVKIGFQLNP